MLFYVSPAYFSRRGFTIDGLDHEDGGDAIRIVGIAGAAVTRSIYRAENAGAYMIRRASPPICGGGISVMLILDTGISGSKIFVLTLIILLVAIRISSLAQNLKFSK